MKPWKSVTFASLLITAWSYGIAVGNYKLFPMTHLRAWKASMASNAEQASWGDRFSKVKIASTADGATQLAFAYLVSGDSKPLVVSLHNWSGSYASGDGLAERVADMGWNYIHPDVRGANNSPDACLSPLVNSDIDDAIQYAIDRGSVDPRNIFVVGGSGGGYTALGAYLRSRHQLRAVLAWNSITDLLAWQNETLHMGEAYHADIARCATSHEEAKQRSPLHMPMRATTARLELFAGLHDGHTGPVPLSHTAAFFNKAVVAFGRDNARLPSDLMANLLTRNVTGGIDTLDGRRVFLRRDTPEVALTVFDGGHELMAAHTLRRLAELADRSAP